MLHTIMEGVRATGEPAYVFPALVILVGIFALAGIMGKRSANQKQEVKPHNDLRDKKRQK